MLASTKSLHCVIRTGGWIRREREGNPWRWSVQFIPRVSGYRREDFLIRRRVRAHLPARLAHPRQSQQDNRHPCVHIIPQPAPLPQDPPVRLKRTEEPATSRWSSAKTLSSVSDVFNHTKIQVDIVFSQVTRRNCCLSNPVYHVEDKNPNNI